MRTIQLEIDANALTCGKCDWLDSGDCMLFLEDCLLPAARCSDGCLRCPRCLEADTDPKKAKEAQ